jgi:hypothetical protein
MNQSNIFPTVLDIKIMLNLLLCRNDICLLTEQNVRAVLPLTAHEVMENFGNTSSYVLSNQVQSFQYII